MIDFIEPLHSRVIGIAYLLLAFGFLHFALPAVIKSGRWHIVKFWCFAIALGTFGLGRLFGPIYLEANAWIYALGHYGLLTYATLRLGHIMLRHKCDWWNTP
ncbi:hypothetical protein [Novosphingopyxis sp. YJ-S2-01]|uniref:hypothetical protein n=1 Tax=Novosphingopyxis sp. YJ-S2-01 TaxID=2794021 RepID=UPI0018DD2ECB|nr:hypothetical protein [Novosphingopyxis sp. YJ-S2-01]MBH9537888.1 hypothetical protein [Novosphingopyxis sp. YJ-S2-01]